MIEFPSLGGNWVDLLIISFLLLSLFGGWQRGFLAGLFDLSGFLASFLLALKFYSWGAKFLIANFSLTPGMAKALGFFLLAILAETLFSLFLSFFYAKIPRKFIRTFENPLLGVLPSLGQTLIFMAFVLTLTLGLPIKGAVKSDILSSKLGGSLVDQTQGVERQLSQVFGGAIEETLNFFTIKTETRETVDLRFTQKELSVDYTSEKIIFQLVNKERASRGLKILDWDGQLQAVAQNHAKDMFEKGYFSHYNPEGLSPADRLQAAGINFSVTGENLALAPSVEIAHRGLIESPGHRANILSEDFGRVGIGVIDGGVYGKMFTQEFAD